MLKPCQVPEKSVSISLYEAISASDRSHGLALLYFFVPCQPDRVSQSTSDQPCKTLLLTRADAFPLGETRGIDNEAYTGSPLPVLTRQTYQGISIWIRYLPKNTPEFPRSKQRRDYPYDIPRTIRSDRKKKMFPPHGTYAKMGHMHVGSSKSL